MLGRIFFVCTFCFAFTCLTGCGNGNVPLRGKVTFSDDGSPLTAGTIAFATPTFNARGVIQPDGSFDVGSFGETDGLPPDEYAISITGAAVPSKEGNEDSAWIPLIDDKYTFSQTSGLTLVVNSSTKNYDVQVDRYVETKKNGKNKKPEK